jgi:hypothetical protein
MTESNSFVETGVLVGHCVLLDPHHTKCKSYINDSTVLYTSHEVWSEYENTKRKVTGRLSSAVLDHVRDVENRVSEDYLDPMNVDRIKKRVLHQNNDAYRFLYRYYNDVVNNGVAREELEKNLREIARDIDRLVVSREEDLNAKVMYYEPVEDHKSVRNSLSDIHDPDRTYAVQAHDLACQSTCQTEFATTNPKDFVYNGRKEMVLSNTKLDDIVDLSV